MKAHALALSVLPALLALVLVAGDAHAGLSLDPPTDCPPGSLGKASGAFAWCEPSVCLHDANCTPGELCRTVPLCIEVGTLSDSGKAGEQRLAATQRCGPGGACPSNQVCSVKDRCLSKAAAQKLGVLEPPKPPTAPSAEPEEPPVKKSACGCDVVGRPVDGAPAFAALAALGLVVRARRRPLRPRK